MMSDKKQAGEVISEAKEKVLLVIIETKKKRDYWHAVEILKEMKMLVDAADAETVDHMVSRHLEINAKTYIGSGLLQELEKLVKLKEIDTVIFSEDLKGSQQRNIEAVLNVKTIDRTQLILDIFARHARSREGKMQVELAQLEYLLPRLVGKGIELSRLGGGIGTLGPGETKLEIDRRRIQTKILRLKKGLKEVIANREVKRKQRKDRGVPLISLVGYTNAGKSTILNILTDSKQVTRDGVFTTLDSLSRQLVLPNHQKVVLSDTVGFMNELPHHLIESFKATLEEVHEADLLIHVLDISDVNFRLRHKAVCDVLKEMDVFEKPVILVLNKIDKVVDAHWLCDIEGKFDCAVMCSAAQGENIDKLLELIVQMVSEFFVEINVTIPIDRMDLVNLAHQEGDVFSIKYYNDTINIRASVPVQIAGKFS